MTLREFLGKQSVYLFQIACEGCGETMYAFNSERDWFDADGNRHLPPTNDSEYDKGWNDALNEVVQMFAPGDTMRLIMNKRRPAACCRKEPV